jgi:hypothetical protein
MVALTKLFCQAKGIGELRLANFTNDSVTETVSYNLDKTRKIRALSAKNPSNFARVNEEIDAYLKV